MRRSARAARDVVAKIGDILPKHLKPVLFEPAVDAPRFTPGPPEDAIDVAALRAAIRERRKVWIEYQDEQGRRRHASSGRWRWATSRCRASSWRGASCEATSAISAPTACVRPRISPQRYRGNRAKLLGRWRSYRPG